MDAKKFKKWRKQVLKNIETYHLKGFVTQEYLKECYYSGMNYIETAQKIRK